MKEAKIIEIELVREKYRERYGKFLLVLNKNNPRLKELEGKLDDASKNEKRELEIEIIKARVIVSNAGCAALCKKCGSYAVKHYNPKIDDSLDGKLEEYACKVCGFNRFAENLNQENL